jgi:prevent-host-death family protein
MSDLGKVLAPRQSLSGYFIFQGLGYLTGRESNLTGSADYGQAHDVFLNNHLLQPNQHTNLGMYEADGVNTIASITELRTETDQIIQRAEESPEGSVLVQRNNKPIAVLVSIDQWNKLRSDDGSFRGTS